MKRNVFNFIFSSTAAISLAATPAFANPFYAPGDLVLAFQKPGNSNTVYVSLGNAATLFRGPATGPDVLSNVNFVDINATLTSAFGAGWASDAGIYAGVAGVFGTSTSSTVLTNGDPHRTLYVSQSRNAVGTVGAADSTQWDLVLAGNTAMSSGSTGIKQQNDVLDNNYVLQAVVSPTSTSRIDEMNPFTSPGIQGPAMLGALEGGIQQVGSASSFGTFGYAGSVEFALDIYRVLARNNISGQIPGDQRIGSFEGTITVSTTGKVSFITAPTPYDDFIFSYPTVTPYANRITTADQDGDDLNNLEEFVFNTDPTVKSSAPALDNSGSNFVFNLQRRTTSVGNTTLIYEYSTDLTNWTPTTIGTTSETIGNVTIGVVPQTGYDSLSVSIPKTLAPDGKLFGRFKVSRP